MNYSLNEAGVARVADYFERIGRHLPRHDQRASFATYAFGILAEGDRKSVEPIAARADPDPEEAARTHDRLLHFLRESPWNDRSVRREAAGYVIEALQRREPITTWILDDTGMLKQGKHSPGVQRQYTGSAGKIANCQIAVTLSIATRTEQIPIDCELYLPKSWINDRDRCAAARIPESVPFLTKTEQALEMIRRAASDGIPGDIVLADAFYGRSHELRQAVRGLGLDYAMAIDLDTKVWVLDTRERRRGEPSEVGSVGEMLPAKAFRKVTWRDGTHGKLASRFCFRRVKVAQDDGTEPSEREPVWLAIEWPYDEAKPTRFVLTTLRRRMTKKQIVRTIKERWKTERVYQELKGELGFDHFEGRSFTGWHHHVSVVLCCYAFVVAERVRAFSPSARRPRQADPLAIAA
jgi:SRSO17 transposase